MKEVDVIIISWAKDDKLHKVTQLGLDTLFASENPDEIKFNPFVIESNHDVMYDKTTTIHPDVPYGYHRYLNIGRKAGNAEFVCLCNNDLFFYKGWATEILKVMDEYPRVLSASPFCPRSHMFEYNLKPYEGLNFGGGIGLQIMGHCIFQRRKIYEIIGDLDEQFDHWCCDWDYGNTLTKFSIDHVLVTSSIVDHLPFSRSLFARSAEEIEKLSIGQYAKFNEKWKNGIK